MLEKYKLIKNMSPNVLEKKPEELSTEVIYLVDGQANSGGAKVIFETVLMELDQDKPINKFEVAAFAKYVLLEKTMAARENAELLRQTWGTSS